MNKADVSKFVSKLRFAIAPKKRLLSNPEGPEGRLNKMRKLVTGLIKYERIEVAYFKGDEARGYAERVISEAIRHGDTHKPTMEMAEFWILEKQLVHKLFKVLVPRLQPCPITYTRMYRAPKVYPGKPYPLAVLELRGHPYPSLTPDTTRNRNLIQNVLLDEAKKEYRREKYEQMAKQLAPMTGDGEGSSGSIDSGASQKTETEPETETENSAPSKEDPDTDNVRK